MNKISKTAITLDKFTRMLRNIGKILLILGGIALIGGLFLIILNPTDFSEHFLGNQPTKQLATGNALIMLKEECVIDKNSLITDYVNLVLSFLYTIASYIALGYIHNMLQPMKGGLLFTEETSSNIRKLAYMIIPCGIIRNLFLLVRVIVFNRFTDISAITQSSVIQSIKLVYRFDYNFIFVFLILFFVSYVFRYGETLQEKIEEMT